MTRAKGNTKVTKTNVRVRQYNRTRHDNTKGKTVSKEDVIVALNKGDWDYRTSKGLAKELHVDKNQIESVLFQQVKAGRVAESRMRTPDGERLYYSSKRKNSVKDFWEALKVAIKGGGKGDE